MTEHLEEEVDRLWRRLKRVEDDMESLANEVRDDLRSIRADIRDFRAVMVTRFNGVDGELSPPLRKRVVASVGTMLAVASGIGVPIAVAWALSGGPT